MVSARRAWSSEGVRQAAPCPPHVPPHAAAPPRSPRGDPQRGARASPSHAAVKAWTLPPRALYSQGEITAEISSEKSFLAKPNSPHLQKKSTKKKNKPTAPAVAWHKGSWFSPPGLQHLQWFCC